MKIVVAEMKDAPIIHDVMIQAFQEFKDATPPTSALQETVQSVEKAMQEGEEALIGYIEGEPVTMIRFRQQEQGMYFSRFSVIPKRQRQGIAKQMLRHLEDYAKQRNTSTLLCKVRADVEKNISLYESIGYHVYDKEILHRSDGTSVAVVSMKKSLDE
ncbi:GNAT family N-acetyltransferase [Sporosarcina sp. PTS2304]|uniref:GNAT family N-acetyltransferase n=1 Tax=Sporosarcina sp. PTS2304 TaxID=2283194 RepID=UPI000E0DDBCF|nr:GNAT family N-acetyltransferase [Sporosarcina sp. PTS2304]AXH99252.1 GNAT family N-acetyltransferase [Sporosarcina sp. PTS2304]